MKNKSLFRVLAAQLLLVVAFVLAGCGNNKDESGRPLKVGVIAGPEAELMKTALSVADREYGLKSKVVIFQDYVTPDIALADGSIDVNAFQHKLYLDDINRARGYKLAAVGKTFLYPLGAYSKKIKHIDQLADGARISIPNDPSNESRALDILEQAGLIRLKDSQNFKSTPADIVHNPKKFKFLELDAAQLPRSLDDVDLSLINSTYAVANGLLPKHDALILEDSNSPYVNLVVTREDKKEDPRIKKLLKGFYSQEVIDQAETLFKGGAIPGWKESSGD